MFKNNTYRLYDYCTTVCKCNIHNTMILKVDRVLTPPTLQKIYVCLCTQRDGFKASCKCFIGLDGCFLKCIYKGQLLIVVGFDDNSNIYLIACAFVGIEKLDSWSWLLDILIRKDLGEVDGG